MDRRSASDDRCDYTRAIRRNGIDECLAGLATRRMRSTSIVPAGSIQESALRRSSARTPNPFA